MSEAVKVISGPKENCTFHSLIDVLKSREMEHPPNSASMRDNHLRPFSEQVNGHMKTYFLAFLFTRALGVLRKRERAGFERDIYNNSNSEIGSYNDS
jgi:hypothetical protein